MADWLKYAVVAVLSGAASVWVAMLWFAHKWYN